MLRCFTQVCRISSQSVQTWTPADVLCFLVVFTELCLVDRRPVGSGGSHGDSDGCSRDARKRPRVVASPRTAIFCSFILQNVAKMSRVTHLRRTEETLLIPDTPSELELHHADPVVARETHRSCLTRKLSKPWVKSCLCVNLLYPGVHLWDTRSLQSLVRGT